ncbi:MAG: NAD(P)-dependent oxidoreductase [Desulfuromonas sp.]|nr:MAG: NAD(P)-dependent oxidoreductase [Desulfuromonas sp.]
MPQLLIVGFGDIGQRTARLATSSGFDVSVASRSIELKASEQDAALNLFTANLDRLGTLGGLPTKQSMILYLAPPPPHGITDPRVQNFCNSIRKGELPVKIVYVSTSGVYGDCSGDLVNETRPPHPETDLAKRRADAEKSFRKWGMAHGVPIIILRVAGIYGPGRLPVQRLKEGTPVLRKDQAPYSNRIHADDLARVCLAAVQKGTDGSIYNVCDGEESTMTDYFKAVADMYGLPEPPVISMAEAQTALSPEMLSYLLESRRLDNSRMIDRLGVELLYPELEQGLSAIRDEMLEKE